MNTKVVNMKTDNYTVDITRKSKWGNPFIIGIDGTREEVIEFYEEWARNNEYLMLSLGELEEEILGCVCKPKKCHGDVLIKLLKERKERKK